MFIAHTAHTFEALATLHAQSVHLVLTMGACGDTPWQFLAKGCGGWTGFSLGILKAELPPLGRAAFASSPGDLGVKDIRAIGLQVSGHVGTGVEVHPLVAKLDAYKWARMRENDVMIALVLQLGPPLGNLFSRP